MFAALQRQLGYPAVPRATPLRTGPIFAAPVEQRFQRLEARLLMLEQEANGTFDPSQLLKQSNAPDLRVEGDQGR
jgi:hypothetical protein